MERNEGYEVLRLTGQGSKYYASTDYLEGTPFVWWIKYHPKAAKEQIFDWIYQIVCALEGIHKCEELGNYGYVNPYSLIMSEEKTLYFLDLRATSNEEALARMQRRDVREAFLPQGAYYGRSVRADLYGLGRTFQWLFTQVGMEPDLTVRERRRMLKIIRRLVSQQGKNAYKSVSAVKRDLPRCDDDAHTGAFAKPLPIVAATVCGIAVLMLLFTQVSEGKDANDKQKITIAKETEDMNDGEASVGSAAEKVKQLSKENEELETKLTDEKATYENSLAELSEEALSLRRELGLLYFLELKDYERSEGYFRMSDTDLLSQQMVLLVQWMEQKGIADESYDPSALLACFSSIEELMPQTEENSYEKCLLRAYAKLYKKTKSDQAKAAVKRLKEAVA